MIGWLTLCAGLGILILGGELLVRGAVQVATHMGVSPLIIGLTLVGFGTSTPELVASVQAVLSNSPGIAYGNIVGSNIANILLTLGAAALIAPIAINDGALKRDGAVMVGAAVLFAGFAALHILSIAIGIFFVGTLMAYVFFAYLQERNEKDTGHGAVYDKSQATQMADPALSADDKPARSIGFSLGLTSAGLGFVILGGYLLVGGALSIAQSMGVSETAIGLTIVAIGTSLPEFITTVLAAMRKQSEIAFGNIVGSNIYNIFGIGGFTALMSSAQVPDQIIRVDNLVMIAASIIVVGMAYTARTISRIEGSSLLVGYMAYLTWLWL